MASSLSSDCIQFGSGLRLFPHIGIPVVTNPHS
jgi:hypothetical protein